MRKSIITSHIDKVVERSDSNLMIVIRKFGWIGCLPRSVWGIIAILSIVATVVLSVKRMPLGGILGFASILLWVSAWVDANDRLKKNIYPDVLEMHLLKTGKLTAPFAIKHFHPQQDLIECRCGARRGCRCSIRRA